jgi:ABC-2 type transport system permease protein
VTDATDTARSHDDARIYDQGYRPFDGTLASPRSRFWVIAVHELRLAWKEKWFRRLLWVSYFPLMGFGVYVLLLARFEGLVSEMSNMGDVWQSFWGMQMFFSMLVVYFVGRRAVGEDLRTGALTVYFSRPVSFAQYLTGKWLAIAVGVAGVSLLPALLLSVFRWLAEPATGAVTFAGWVGSFLILSILMCLTMGWIMLAVSSLTQRGRAAGIVWIILFFVTAGVAEGVARGTGYFQLEALGFSKGNMSLAAYLLEGKGTLLDAAWMLLGQLAWILVAVVVVMFRLRKWVKA